MAIRERDIGSQPTSLRSLRARQTMLAHWNNPTWVAHAMEALRGHKTSEEARRKIGDKNRQKYSTLEARREISLKKGGSFIKAYPLLIRGASVQDVINIAGMHRAQVEGVINRMKLNGEIKKPTKEEESQAKHRARLNNDRIRQDSDFAKLTKESSAFAKDLFGNGFIHDDLNSWRLLNHIYKEDNRYFPADLGFGGKIILEAFLNARRLTYSGDRSLLESYHALGELIGGESFDKLTPEHLYITKTLKDRPFYNFMKLLD